MARARLVTRNGRAAISTPRFSDMADIAYSPIRLGNFSCAVRRSTV